MTGIEVGGEWEFKAEVAGGCGLDGEELLFVGGEGGHEVSVPKAGCQREGADGIPHPRPPPQSLGEGAGGVGRERGWLNSHVVVEMVGGNVVEEGRTPGGCAA